MELTPAQWTAVTRLFWTVLTLGIAFTVGHLINAIVISRMRRLAARTQGLSPVVPARQLPRLQRASCFGAQGWSH